MPLDHRVHPNPYAVNRELVDLAPGQESFRDAQDLLRGDILRHGQYGG